MMQSAVQPTMNSMHFLYAAYILVAAANVGFALWLRSLWVQLRGERRAGE